MIYAAAILISALVLDLILGDPPFPLHPVRLIGSAISGLERLFLRLGWSGLIGGSLLVSGTLVVSLGLYLAVHSFLRRLHPFLASVLDLYLAYSFLALKDLVSHATPVAQALARSDLMQARTALQKIVGRDTSNLDTQGVVRGAVESVAENFVDGVLSPMFWYTLPATLSYLAGCPSPVAAGILTLLCFKVISTLDSMVGYRSNHYLLFGRPAARLDDLANFLPARLSLIILYLGALFSGESAREGWKIALRDRLKHPSPNAGHPESFMAGTLGIKLGGPAVYQEGIVDKPWLGNGGQEMGPEHIRRSCRMVYRSSWAALALMTVLLVFLSFVG
ncbi:MAG: adenosylcobinamide-phosphate synthase CbiB [Deltaproteobacteria bacterium]